MLYERDIQLIQTQLMSSGVPVEEWNAAACAVSKAVRESRFAEEERCYTYFTDRVQRMQHEDDPDEYPLPEGLTRERVDFGRDRFIQRELRRELSRLGADINSNREDIGVVKEQFLKMRNGHKGTTAARVFDEDV